MRNRTLKKTLLVIQSLRNQIDQLEDELKKGDHDMVNAISCSIDIELELIMKYLHIREIYFPSAHVVSNENTERESRFIDSTSEIACNTYIGLN